MRKFQMVNEEQQKLQSCAVYARTNDRKELLSIEAMYNMGFFLCYCIL